MDTRGGRRPQRPAPRVADLLRERFGDYQDVICERFHEGGAGRHVNDATDQDRDQRTAPHGTGHDH